jgi:hypothetical protein
MAERNLWLARRNTVERTYGHTLYLVLITSLFYWTLDRRLDDPGIGWPDLKLPFIQTGLSSAAVWATGPFVVSFLTLALLGTLEARGRVDRAIGVGRSAAGAESEQLATSLTALDLSFYASRDSPRLWRAVAAVVLPLVLTAPWVLSVRLLCSPLWSALPWPDQSWIPRVLGILTAGACVPRLGRLWVPHSTRVWHLLARRESALLPTGVCAPEPDAAAAPSVELWRARCTALDRIQARYFYLLLIASIFYWALDRQFYPIGMSLPPRVTFAFIQIELSSLLVWATGPAVMAFLCLALLGADTAVRQANSTLAVAQAASTVDGELLDAEPTVLEMAFYCTPDAHRLWRACTALSQPVALTLPWTFAAWLLVSPLWWAFADFDQYWGLRLAGTVMVIACIPRLARLWVAAGRKVRLSLTPSGSSRA